jgi:acetolactate synthase-1/2/3 large subunit
MTSPERLLTGADVLVRRLQAHGVRHVFGYPGGQLTPIYDALYRQSTIRHILARDEQAAAFMADGYARATGKPGVCLAVCGPGVYNAATALATSFTDSVPVLCISGQVPSDGLGLRSGYYHENEQHSACATFTKVPSHLSGTHEVDRAFEELTYRRPGPVLIEIPLDMLRNQSPGLTLDAMSERLPPKEQALIVSVLQGTNDPLQQLPPIAPSPLAGKRLAELLQTWRQPLVLAGGGVIAAGAEAELAQTAERLGAPVLTTLMGKCAIASDHPLAAGLTWLRATQDVSNMDEFFSPLFKQCDGVLAIGCRFTQASTGSWKLQLPALAHIDIDAAEIGRHYPATLGMQADAKEALRVLLDHLPPKPRQPWAQPPVPRRPWRLPGVDLVGPMRRVLPRDVIIAADITRLSYILLAEFPVYTPRSFLHPAGFVPMGFGLPAAIGAKAAFPERVVVTVVGDGCFQMCGMELATLGQEKLPVIVILVNDNCLSLIKATQKQRYEGRYIGVDLHNPDFGIFARAFGVRAWQVDSDPAFEAALREAVASNEPALIEVRLPASGAA